MTKTLLSLGLTAAAMLPGESSKIAIQNKPGESTPFVEASSGSKVIQYGERDVVPIDSRIRFTTMIVLPKSEQILDFVTGDKEFWIVNGVGNFAFIKPAKAGSRTNLNLITASGNVYSFVLTESDRTPDMKVFIEPKDTSLLSAITGEPKFVPAAAVKDFEAQYKLAKENERFAVEQADVKVREAEAKAAEAKLNAVEQARQLYPANVKYDYKYERDRAPFLVSSIYHDDKFTYIKAAPEETPALYEVKDGKPSLIQFDFKEGLYTAPKILDSGYLQIGKKRMPFEREAKR